MRVSILMDVLLVVVELGRLGHLLGAAVLHIHQCRRV